MITLLKNIFLSHWERKAISAILAVIIWLVVNHSLIAYQILENVSVRVINIPTGMTVEGIQPNGTLQKKISLTVCGNKTYIDEVTSNDLEVVLDATGKSGEWLASVTSNNLIPLNPEIDISKIILRVSPLQFPIFLTRLVTEKIPVTINSPIGEAPHNYQLLDVWPNHLDITITGPKSVVSELKNKGLNLTFNLNQISSTDLEQIQTHSTTDEISFLVPEEWKNIVIPSISSRPITIDDPLTDQLRINFIRSELYPINKTVPVTLFYPPESNPNFKTYQLAVGGMIQSVQGLHMLQKSLYVKGVSRFFVELVQDMIEIAVVIAPKSEKRYLDWRVQFINPLALEDRYVSLKMSDVKDPEKDPILFKKKEEHLRDRFRKYMNQFQLYKSKEALLDLKIELKGNSILLAEGESFP